MSLDNRLRKGLDEFAAHTPPRPLDVGSDLQGVLVAGRRREVLQRAYRGIAILALLLIAALGIPSLLREFGSQEVNTADDPGIESDVDDGDTNAPSETSDVSRPSLGGFGSDGTRGDGGGKPQAGQRTSTTHQQPSTGQAGAARIPTPVAAGTYFYDLSGYFCGDFAPGCHSAKERKDTYDRPGGSHQRSTSRWTTSAGKFDAEYGYDFRADGVYWEHFHYTVTDNNGVVRDTFACPELAVTPSRVWPAGAKPGDHFEDTRPCNPYVFESGDSRTIVDILRAETVSIGGRDVSTLFVRVEWRRGNYYNITEGWVFHDNYLFVKEDLSWFTRHNRGEYHTMLESMTPS